jgi:hypothetical protein
MPHEPRAPRSVLLSSGMRKRWRLVLFGFLAVVAVLFAVISKTSDELRELRPFHPHISLTRVWTFGGPPLPNTCRWIIRFPETPPELFKVLNIPPKSTSKKTADLPVFVKLPSGFQGEYYYETKELWSFTRQTPSWLEWRWIAVKRALGLADIEESNYVVLG